MLRVYQNQSVADAKKYFSKSAGEYYVDGQQELRGYWRGKAANMLGLSGEITQAQWNAICDGFNPLTGEKLVQRVKSNRTVGYDFTFSPGGKAVSILYNMTQDERILKAFRESVGETMKDIESEVQTRVRKGGKNEDRTVGNMVWGEFVHLTARPLDDGICYHSTVSRGQTTRGCRFESCQLRSDSRQRYPTLQASVLNRGNASVITTLGE